MVKALTTKNVVTVLTALALTIGISFAFVAPAKADTVSDLQAQVQALLAQIQALQGSSTTTTTTSGSSAGCYTFTQNLSLGKSGGEVMWVQQFLNNHGFTVAASGAGSPGNETSYFGPATKRAVIAFQNANAASILTPVGLTAGNGNWFAGTRAKANAICAGSTTTTTTTGGTTTTGAGITITAGSQPANSLAPQLASRVPFTTFTLTNNSGAAVTINGITVQRTGLAQDAAFNGVELIDQNGLQIGTSRTFDSNHQATIGTPWTLAAGASMTYTVAGNMAANESTYAGEVAAVTVIGVNTSVPVNGSLPISGAQQTINATLAIGTAQAAVSSFDPDNTRTESIGTTGITFSGIRLTAGSAEDQKLYSITWNQTGSVGSNDISNLVTVVNGTSYPVTVDSTGKYFTASFAGGLLIPKGNTIDAYIKGDLTGNDASGRTVEFDIYRQSDIYLVGQTYGYGVTPTASSPNAFNSASNHLSTFTSTTPFFEGAIVQVQAGTLSTLSNAGSVSSQNIAINVTNQPLGGFTTNFTGEPVSVQQMVFHVASSTAGVPLTNVTLVDSNGNVVAGPVDEVVSAGTVTFNSSVTFPVGAMTYTIKGEVGNTATNGMTFTLSTTPSADWTNAQGQISGSNVTISTGQVVLSTMTIEGPSLVISNSSSPASTNVAKGSQNFVFANINLDASQSGENIRLSSLPITLTAANGGVVTDLSSCQLWNGTTALNTGGNVVNSANWSSANPATFVFDNSLTIPKGTVVTLSLSCNLSSSATTNATYTLGVNSSGTQASPTGVGSGITLTSTNGDLIVQNNIGGTMTVGSASLAVSVPTPVSYAQVAGGTTGVTVGTFTLQPTSDTVNLQTIGLALNSNFASSSDITRAYIYNGATQVGSVIFTGSPAVGTHFYYATSTLGTSLNLPQNVQTVLTIKADVSQIGSGQAGMDGHEIRIGLADARGAGVSSGATVDSGVGTPPTTGIAIFKTFPTVAASSYLPANGVSDGRLIAFTVTPNSTGTVGINKLTFTVNPSSGTTVTSPVLYAYIDSGFSQAAGGTTGGIVGTTTVSGTTVTATMSTPLEISQTTYFLLQGTVSGCGTACNVATKLLGDTNDLAPNMYTVAGIPASFFVWSPNATTTALTTTSDWTNGAGVSGLPTSGITQNRTQ